MDTKNQTHASLSHLLMLLHVGCLETHLFLQMCICSYCICVKDEVVLSLHGRRVMICERWGGEEHPTFVCQPQVNIMDPYIRSSLKENYWCYERWMERIWEKKRLTWNTVCIMKEKKKSKIRSCGEERADRSAAVRQSANRLGRLIEAFASDLTTSLFGLAAADVPPTPSSPSVKAPNTLRSHVHFLHLDTLFRVGSVIFQFTSSRLRTRNEKGMS